MTATLNAAETMRMLRITRSTLAAMLADGELRGFIKGKVIRIDRRSVEQLLNGCTATGADAGSPTGASTIYSGRARGKQSR